jgi:hypothetical protein
VTRPVGPGRSEVDSQGRWQVAAVGAGLAILLLLAANVQLWRVAERADDQSEPAPAVAEIPPLPKTEKGGNRSLLRSLDASERELRRSLAAVQSAVAGASGGAGSAGLLVGRLDTLTTALRQIDDGSPQMTQVTDQLEGLAAELRKLGPVKRDIRSLSASTGKVTDETDSLLARSDLISTRMGTLGDRLDTLRGEIDLLQAQLTGLSGNVTQLDGRMGQTLPLLERGVDGLDILTEFVCQQITPTPPSCPPQPEPEPEPEPEP